METPPSPPRFSPRAADDEGTSGGVEGARGALGVVKRGRPMMSKTIIIAGPAPPTRKRAGAQQAAVEAAVQPIPVFFQRVPLQPK